MRSAAPCGRFPCFMPFPAPLHGTLPPNTCAWSRFVAITTLNCRHYHIDLPPNSCRFGGKLPPFPHGASVVPARYLSVTHMDGTTSPCRGKAQTTDHGSRSLSWIFTCSGAGNATSPFICGCEAIPTPGKAVVPVVPVGATESRCGRRSRAGRHVRSARRGGRRASRRTGMCGEGRSSAPAVRALPAAPS